MARINFEKNILGTENNQQYYYNDFLLKDNETNSNEDKIRSIFSNVENNNDKKQNLKNLPYENKSKIIKLYDSVNFNYLLEYKDYVEFKNLQDEKNFEIVFFL